MWVNRSARLGGGAPASGGPVHPEPEPSYQWIIATISFLVGLAAAGGVRVVGAVGGAVVLVVV
jgi:hypothetical protein